MALYGCADAKSWLGLGSYKTAAAGQRVSVLQLNQSLVADPALADVKVLLPAALCQSRLAAGGRLSQPRHAASGAGQQPERRLDRERRAPATATTTAALRTHRGRGPRLHHRCRARGSAPSTPPPAARCGASTWPRMWIARSCWAAALPMTTAGSSSPRPSPRSSRSIPRSGKELWHTTLSGAHARGARRQRRARLRR